MWEYVLRFIQFHPEITMLGAVTLIQIAPIRINPWSWCGRMLRKVITGDMDAKLDKIAGKVDRLEEQYQEDKAGQSRNHILRFADELYNGERHSKEYFDEILADCDRYEKYCEQHPNYKNSKTVMSTKLIKETYDRLIQEHKFL